MVLVRRTAVVAGARQKVFDFISNFDNIARWDPGTVKATRRDSSSGKPQLGTTFDLVTVFKGSEANMVYKLVEFEEGKKCRYDGTGDAAVTVDVINFKDGPAPDTTELEYVADIRLKGWRVIFTPFVSADIQKLGDEAINGIKKTCSDLFESTDSSTSKKADEANS